LLYLLGEKWVASVLDKLAQGCRCRNPHPRRSGGMDVLVEGAAESIVSMDVEVIESGRVKDRMRQWA
jgi:hypothetical protein